VAEEGDVIRRPRRCRYCLDAYRDHTDCTQYLAKMQATLVAVLDVDAQVRAERAARARDARIAAFVGRRRVRRSA